MNQLTILLDDHELFHSEFQIRNLIVARAGGTTYGAYKQAIRELWNRLIGIAAELAKLEHVRNPAIKEQGTENDWLPRQQFMTLMETTPVLKDTLREVEILYHLAGWLRSQLGDLDYQAKQRLEEELWSHRVKCAIAVDFLSTGQLCAPTVELLHALPITMRRSILEILDCPQSHKLLIEWYLTHELDLPIFDIRNHRGISTELIANIFESIDYFQLRRENRLTNHLLPTT